MQQAAGILEGVKLALVGGDGHLARPQLRLGLLEAGLQFGLLALQGALPPARLGHPFLQGRQRGLQLGNLVFPAQNRGGFSRAVAAIVAAGKNAGAAQHRAVQGHKVERAAAFEPGLAGRLEVADNPRLAQQPLDQGADRNVALDDGQRGERHAVQFRRRHGGRSSRFGGGRGVGVRAAAVPVADEGQGSDARPPFPLQSQVRQNLAG